MLRTTSATTRPWVQIQILPRGKRRARTEFHFNPQYLRQFWQEHVARESGARGTFYLPEPERLLLDDVVHYQEHSFFVQAWLVQSNEPAFYHLRVKVAAAPLLLQNGVLTLHWDTDSYSMSLTAGVVEFEDISPPNFSRLRKNLPSPRFRLTIEFSHDRKNGKH